LIIFKLYLQKTLNHFNKIVTFYIFKCWHKKVDELSVANDKKKKGIVTSYKYVAKCFDPQ